MEKKIIRGVLDTNIILRHILKDDPVQSKISTNLLEKLIENKAEFFLTFITFAETIWVLESVYKYNKKEVCNILKPLFNTPNLKLESQDILEEALVLYKTLNIDFADCYNACYGKANDIKDIYSFDKDYNKVKFIDRKEPE